MRDLLSALQKLARGSERLRPLAKRMEGLPYRPETAQHLPVCDAIAALKTPEQTRPVLDALQRHSDTLRWQQTYSRADGMTQDWLDQYGWVNIVSPDGPYVCPDMRVAIGYWGAGQTYPAHAHGPEETYLVIAGGARFEAQGRAAIQAQPGDLIHHAPWQPHAMIMEETPLLAAAFWQGVGLMERSRLDVTLEGGS